MDLHIAKKILGNRFIQPKDLSIPDSPTPLLKTVPFSEAVLKSLENCRLMLLPVTTEWTLGELLASCPRAGIGVKYYSSPGKDLPGEILKEKLVEGWHLMYVDAYPGTASRKCSEALSVAYQAPVRVHHATAAMTVWLMMNCHTLQGRVQPGEFTSPYPPYQFTSTLLPDGKYLKVGFGAMDEVELGARSDDYTPSQDEGCAAEILPTE